MKPHAGGLLGVRPEAREHSVRLVACHMHDAIALKRAGDALDHKLQCIFKASFTIEQIYSFFLGGASPGVYRCSHCSFEATSGLQASCPRDNHLVAESAVNRDWVEAANHPALDCLADMSQINPEKSTPLSSVFGGQLRNRLLAQQTPLEMWDMCTSEHSQLEPRLTTAWLYSCFTSRSGLCPQSRLDPLVIRALL